MTNSPSPFPVSAAHPSNTGIVVPLPLQHPDGHTTAFFHRAEFTPWLPDLPAVRLEPTAQQQVPSAPLRQSPGESPSTHAYSAPALASATSPDTSSSNLSIYGAILICSVVVALILRHHYRSRRDRRARDRQQQEMPTAGHNDQPLSDTTWSWGDTPRDPKVNELANACVGFNFARAAYVCRQRSRPNARSGSSSISDCWDLMPQLLRGRFIDVHTVRFLELHRDEVVFMHGKLRPRSLVVTP